MTTILKSLYADLTRKAGYDPAQERDEEGKWTSGGGSKPAARKPAPASKPGAGIVGMGKLPKLSSELASKVGSGSGLNDFVRALLNEAWSGSDRSKGGSTPAKAGWLKDALNDPDTKSEWDDLVSSTRDMINSSSSQASYGDLRRGLRSAYSGGSSGGSSSGKLQQGQPGAMQGGSSAGGSGGGVSGTAQGPGTKKPKQTRKKKKSWLDELHLKWHYDPSQKRGKDGRWTTDDDEKDNEEPAVDPKVLERFSGKKPADKPADKPAADDPGDPVGTLEKAIAKLKKKLESLDPIKDEKEYDKTQEEIEKKQTELDEITEEEDEEDDEDEDEENDEEGEEEDDDEDDQDDENDDQFVPLAERTPEERAKAEKQIEDAVKNLSPLDAALEKAIEDAKGFPNPDTPTRRRQLIRDLIDGFTDERNQPERPAWLEQAYKEPNSDFSERLNEMRAEMEAKMKDVPGYIHRDEDGNRTPDFQFLEDTMYRQMFGSGASRRRTPKQPSPQQIREPIS